MTPGQKEALREAMDAVAAGLRSARNDFWREAVDGLCDAHRAYALYRALGGPSYGDEAAMAVRSDIHTLQIVVTNRCTVGVSP